jgi:hypothetical protein
MEPEAKTSLPLTLIALALDHHIQHIPVVVVVSLLIGHGVLSFIR